MPKTSDIKKEMERAAEAGGKQQLKDILQIVKQLRDSGLADTGYHIVSPFTRNPPKSTGAPPKREASVRRKR